MTFLTGLLIFVGGSMFGGAIGVLLMGLFAESRAVEAYQAGVKDGIKKGWDECTMMFKREVVA